MSDPRTDLAEISPLPSSAGGAAGAPIALSSIDHSTPILRRTLSSGDHSRIEEFAYLFGNAPESYDIISSTGSLLRTPCGEGFLNVYPDRSCWHIPGGIIAEQIKKPSTILWLKQLADQHRRTIAVYSVNAEELPLFQDAGYVINKFGEEPIIDLADLDWKGKSFEWVRRQTSHCRRQGLNIIEITSRDEQRAAADELTQVFFDDLRHRVYSKPLQLLEGEFNPHALGRRRLFVARHLASKRMEGFLVTSPMENGTSWAFETYRKRSDAIRGTIPYLFREVVDRLQTEGVQQVSLCLVPGKGVHGDKSETADARVRWLLGMWYGRLSLIFNASGQDYFKSRFRPRYVDRYICVYPRNSWGSIFSFLKTSGALQINAKNLVRGLAGSLKIRPKSKGPNAHR
jgi:phosphatidylglycerol lysyltransferase